jgi:hypothetical protein
MLIAAAGIFAIGMVAGIVAVVSHGIHREEKCFQQERRFRVLSRLMLDTLASLDA